MMDVFKTALYSLCAAASLIVVCLCAIWKYDPTLTSTMSRKGLNLTLPWYATISDPFPANPDAVISFSTSPGTNQHSTTAPSMPRNLPSSPSDGVSSPSAPISLSGRPSLTMGYLNYDLWHWIVGYLVDDMRLFREFPLYPDEHKKIKELRTEFNEVDPADIKGKYAHKIYGYLIPPEPGPYTFRVELSELTAAAEVELWVSTTTNPHNISLILNLLHDDLSRRTILPKKSKPNPPTTKSVESKPINLNSEPCYFEFLEKAFDGKVIANMKWKLPSSKEFVAISDSNFAVLSKFNDSKEAVAETLSLPSNKLQSHHRVSSPTNDLHPVTDLKVLPECEFLATYAQPRHVKTYEGVHQVHESRVYPRDSTWFNNNKKADRGNPVIEDKVKNEVVSLYEKAFSESQVDGTVVGLHYMEQTTNKNDGSRFLLEMDVQLHQPKEETVHTSEYVYLKKGSSQLCHTSNFQWTKDVHVYFVVSVKNLGLWVKHLIYNMEEIYAHTGDEHFSLIIVDYQSEDMNIEQEAKRSSFKRIHVVNMQGAFSRSSGLQAGINYVQDEDSIVMTIDMHLTFPVGSVQYVRKHTVQHKMGYTPVFFRLNSGYTEVNYNGFWEVLTYGLYALYKSDWTAFGGFNTKKYGTKWGGEDWDILDRALAKGFEAFRVRPPGLVHYHHTRKGMWGNADIKFTQKWILHSNSSLYNP